MTIQTCPDMTTLENFLLGKLTADEQSAIGEHLQNCTTCTASANTLSPQDEITRAIRSRRVLAGDEAAVAVAAEKGKLLSSQLQTLQPNETIVGGNPQADPNATVLPGTSGAKLTNESEYEFLAPPQQPDEIGRLGEYRILQLLGAGGMGMVFRAEDTRLKRQVALKVMKPTIAANRSAKDRFLREAQFTAAIEHDNIVQIFQVGEDNGVPFIAMPFLKGESLKSRQERAGKLSQSDVLKIGIQVAAGLAAAHERNLIHRDIKPDNIWIEEKTGRAKILDFGLVRATSEDAGLTQSGMVMGTPRYMAPEQALGQDVDHRCDLFSLGSVLYHLASGKLPFEGSNVTATLMAVVQQEPKPLNSVVTGIDPELSQIIARLMSKERDKRPKSAAEVAKSLNAILQRLKQPASPKPAAAVNENPLPVIVTEPTSVLARGKTTARKLTDAARDAQPSANRNHPPKKPAVRLAAAAAGAFLLLLFGTWIIIKDKDGKEIARFKVPEGGSVEAQDDDGKPQKVTTMTESGEKTTPVVPSTGGSATGGMADSFAKNTWTFKPIPVGESEWDKLDASAIPAEERFDWQPKELVGVIGSHSRRHWSWGVSAAISPDGKLAATSTENVQGPSRGDSLIIWDMETQTPKWRISKVDTIYSLRFTPDSKRLIGRSYGPFKWTILDLSGPEPVFVPIDDQTDLQCNVGNPWFDDDRTLLMLTKNPELKLNLYRADWEQKTISASVAQSPAIKEIPYPLTTNWSASPQSNKVIYVTTDNKMFRATVRDGQFVEPEELNVPVTDSDRCHALSPDGNRLVIGSFDGTNPPSISVWDLLQQPPKPGNKFLHIGAQEQLQFSPDGRWLVASYTRPFLFRVTGTELKDVGWLDETGLGNPPQVAFTPDGNRAIVVNGEGFVRFWDLSGDKPVELSPWKPDSGFMFFGGLHPRLHPADGSLMLNRYVAGHGLKHQTWIAGGPTPKPTSVDELLIPYGQLLSLGRNDAVNVPFSDTERPRRTHFDGTIWIESEDNFGEPGHGYSEASADGKMFVTANRYDAKELVAWDLTADRPVVKWRLPFDPALTGQLPGVQPFTFSTNGKVLAVKPTEQSHGTPDHKLLLINPLAEKPAIITRIPLSPAQHGFYKLALSPDGRFIAHNRDATGDIILDHIADGRAQKMRSYPLGHAYGPTWLSYSPDGRYIAYSSAYGVVEVLNLPQLKPVWTWQAPGPVNWLSWTPDARHLVTHNGNKTLYILRLDNLPKPTPITE